MSQKCYRDTFDRSPWNPHDSLNFCIWHLQINFCWCRLNKITHSVELNNVKINWGNYWLLTFWSFIILPMPLITMLPGYVHPCYSFSKYKMQLWFVLSSRGMVLWHGGFCASCNTFCIWIGHVSAIGRSTLFIWQIFGSPS